MDHQTRFRLVVIGALASLVLICGCSTSTTTSFVTHPYPWKNEPAITFSTDLFSTVNEELVTWPDSSLCADAIGGDTGDAPWRYYWRGHRESPALVKDLALDGDWLWGATPQALLRIHRPTLTCERLDESAGAPASYLADAVGLVVDAQGRLWVAGPNGLVRHRAGEWQVLSEDRRLARAHLGRWL